MTFIYRDVASDRVEIEAITEGDINCLDLNTYEQGGGSTTIRIPFEDVEHFIAGIRAEAGQPPAA